MKKLLISVFSAAIVLSIVFIGDAISSNGDLSVRAQTEPVEKRRNGAFRRTYADGKPVVRKTWSGTKRVYRKGWATAKWTGRKTWKTSRMFISRTKKTIY